MGGLLMAGLLITLFAGFGHLGCVLLGVTNPMILGALYNVSTYLGLGVFSLFITYDTSRMITEARAGFTDHVGHALSMFLSIHYITIANY